MFWFCFLVVGSDLGQGLDISTSSISRKIKLKCYDFALLNNCDNVVINKFYLYNHYQVIESLTRYGGKRVCVRSLQCDYVTPQQLLAYCQHVKYE